MIERLDELLKSIRTLQNTMLVVGFVSLAALIGLRGNLAERAALELDSIIATLAIWDPQSEWLAEWAQGEVKARHDLQSISGFSVLYQDNHDHYPRIDSKNLNPNFWVDRIQTWTLHPLPEGVRRLDGLFPNRSRRSPEESAPLVEHPGVSPRLRAPLSLAEFADFWDGLGRLTIASLEPTWQPDRGFRVWRGYKDDDDGSWKFFVDDFQSETDIRAKPDEHQVIGLTLMNMGVVSEKLLYLTCDSFPGACRRKHEVSDEYVLTSVLSDLRRVQNSSSQFEAAEVRPVLVIPAKADLSIGSARGYFSRVLGSSISAVSDWDDADFSYVFPALTAYGLEQLGDFSIEELRRVITSELDRGYTDIELLGAKIPVSGLGYWVTAISIALSCTLLVLVTQLQTLEKQADIETLSQVSTPWIGIFQNPTGPALAILACAGSPAIVAMFLVIYELQAQNISWRLLVFGLPMMPAMFLALKLVSVWRQWNADLSPQ